MATLRGRSVEEGRTEGLALGEKTGREEGYRAGFESGYREGREAGYREAGEAERARIAADAAPLIEALTSLVREVGLRRATALREAREELLPLALEIAKKVVKREVRECPEVALLNIRKAIDLAFRKTGLVVQVHPEDARLIERHATEVFGCFAGLEGVTVKPVEDVGRGGCRVVSGSGVVDLRIEAQLELIEQALFRRIEEGDPEPEPPPAAPAASAASAGPDPERAADRAGVT